MLKKGDILIFKAGDDWIGKSIAWITKSDVSHAAMVCDDGKIVEMGLHGISVSCVKDSDGDTAFLLRLEPECEPNPLVDAANVYINAKTRYDFPALVILAGLLIYREIRPTQKFINISDLIIQKACGILDDMIQKLILKNPEKALVCSQLVYQIYHDCGKNYQIHLENGLFQNKWQNENDFDSEFICLADIIAEDATDNATYENSLNFSDVNETPDDLARKLYETMTEDMELNDAPLFQSPNLISIKGGCRKFLELLETFLEKSKSDIDIDALFVTPADILHNSKNLKLIQSLDITRVKE